MFRILERIKTWHFFIAAVLIAEIFTFVLTLIQSVLRGGMISSELIEIGAIDSIFVSLIVTFILMPIIRYSAKTGLEKQILQREIAERKKMEEVLKRSHEELELQIMERTSELKTAHDRLRSLAAHLQNIREDDRRTIARDIHDELGQALTAVKMDLGWLHNKYADHDTIFAKVGAVLGKLDATILSVKRICTELRPSLLDDFGLGAAMEWQANEFQKRTGMQCTIIEEPLDLDLDKERSITLFRIFQEALTNVIKHANATKVTAKLIQDGDRQVTLEVKDNGKGIADEQLSKPQSFGLIGMSERVYPWGGQVEIAGDKDRGTTVRVIVPLSPGKSRIHGDPPQP